MVAGGSGLNAHMIARRCIEETYKGNKKLFGVGEFKKKKKKPELKPKQRV